MTLARTTMIPLILMIGGCLNSQPQSPTGNSGTTDGGSSGNGSSDGGAAPFGGTMLCSATLSLVGTWTLGNPQPTDFPGGCWPDGAWNFMATMTQNDCTPAPQLAALYRFTVVEDTNYNDTITYLNDPTNMTDSLKISGGEGGVCVGAFLLFSSDGKTVINLRPAVQADGSINGHGEYQVWSGDQR